MQQGLVHVLGLYAVALCFDFQFSLKKKMSWILLGGEQFPLCIL